ncbi:hypothetical protein [Pontibacter sp. SGAir0037]|uniref:hypothetical protein n=1 Tax=Pontibacter sp. SGAir0037 TaxID=2571030 RepID=UPI0010F9CD6C|nr:hypothetical protein [Pontibacter sp. SGAir0037]
MPLHWHLKSKTLIDQLPVQVFPRAVFLGLAGVTMGFITIYFLKLYAVTYLHFTELMLFMLMYAGLSGFSATVVSVYRSLGDGAIYRKASKSDL